MEELIKIRTNPQGLKLVSGKDLFELKTKFVDWVKRRIEKYGFVEGQDFVSDSFSQNWEKGGRPEITYAFTIDMAKELAMVEGNAKGKQARQYFIECERQLNAPKVYTLESAFLKNKLLLN